MRVTLYINKRSFLLVELNTRESFSPWRKAPPVLQCRQSKSRVQPENGLPRVLYIQWEGSRQQNELFVAICDLKETNCIFLYQLEHFWDTHLLQKTDPTLMKAFTGLNLSGLLCLLIKTSLPSFFSGSCSQNFNLEITN